VSSHTTDKLVRAVTYPARSVRHALYHALSHQLFGTDDNHLFMRRICVDHIAAHKSYYKNFVDISFEQASALC
jgi:hypothetical protein